MGYYERADICVLSAKRFWSTEIQDTRGYILHTDAFEYILTLRRLPFSGMFTEVDDFCLFNHFERSRCLDTLDTILNCHILYHYLVVNFMNPLAIAAPVWYVSRNSTDLIVINIAI